MLLLRQDLNGIKTTNTQSGSYGGSHNVLNPYLGLHYIIKATDEGSGSGGGGGTSVVVDRGRNLLHNANFDFWQRLGGVCGGMSAAEFVSSTTVGGPHTSHSSTTTLSNRFCADRWGLWNYTYTDDATTAWNAADANGGVSRHKFDLSDDDKGVLDPRQSKSAIYYMRITNNTNDKVSPSIEQRIEGVDSIYNEMGTITFWAKRNSGSATGTNSLAKVQVTIDGYASGTGDYLDAENTNAGHGGAANNFKMYQTVSSPVFGLNDKWTKYTWTIEVPNIVGVSAGVNADPTSSGPPSDWPNQPIDAPISGVGFVSLKIHPLPDLHATDSAITEGNTAGDHTWKGAFDIAQVQFEAGSAATDFDNISLHDDLENCRRYYQKSYSLEDRPGATAGVGIAQDDTTQIVGTGLQTEISFPVVMRCPPTVDIYNYSGTKNRISGGNVETIGDVVPHMENDLDTSLGTQFGAWRVLGTRGYRKTVTGVGFAHLTPGEAGNISAADGTIFRTTYHYIADAEI